jgi:hypothetical protein
MNQENKQIEQKQTNCTHCDTPFTPRLPHHKLCSNCTQHAPQHNKRRHQRKRQNRIRRKNAQKEVLRLRTQSYYNQREMSRLQALARDLQNQAIEYRDQFNEYRWEVEEQPAHVHHVHAPPADNFHFSAPVAAEEDDDVCNICMAHKKQVAIIPCGHVCLCTSEACRNGIRAHGQCPICRGPITNFMQVYN